MRQKQFEKGTTYKELGLNLDPRLDHIQGVLFYPFWIPWSWRWRTPKKFKPSYAVMFDFDHKRAYEAPDDWVKKMSRGHIQWWTETYWGRSHARNYLMRQYGTNNITFMWRAPAREEVPTIA